MAPSVHSTQHTVCRLHSTTLTSAKQSSNVLMAPSDARTEPSGSGTGTSCLVIEGPARLPLLLRRPDPAAAAVPAENKLDLSAKGLSVEAVEALKALLLVLGGSKTSLPPMLDVRGRMTTRMGPLWPWAARARSCKSNVLVTYQPHVTTSTAAYTLALVCAVHLQRWGACCSVRPYAHRTHFTAPSPAKRLHDCCDCSKTKPCA
jgi:hypothetical protein